MILQTSASFPLPSPMKTHSFLSRIVTVLASAFLMTLSAGVATAAAQIDLSPTTKAFADTDVGVDSPAQLFTISNAGDAVLNITDIALTGTNPGDFVITGNPTSVPAKSGGVDGTATFTVKFHPLAYGNRSATLTVTSPAGSRTAGLSGKGLGPDLSVTGVADAGSSTMTNVDLGSGTLTTTKTFTITNPGTSDLTISGVTGQTANFEVTTAPPGTLASLATATFVVTFHPSTPGPKSATLNILSDAPSPQNSYNITLDATALAPEISVKKPTGPALVDGAVNPVDMGQVQVGSNDSLQFTIENSGDSGLSNLAVSLVGDPNFSITAQPGATLGVGSATTTFTVRFTPTSRGVKTAALQITSNDSDENPFDINLTATGIAPVIVVETSVGANITDDAITPQDLGNIYLGVPEIFSFTIRNDGDAALTGLSISLNGTNASDFKVLTPPASSLEPGIPTTFTLQVTPSALGGRNAAIHIANNDPVAGRNPFDINLTANGVAIPVFSDGFGYKMNPLTPPSTLPAILGTDPLVRTTNLTGDDQTESMDLGFSFLYYDKAYTSVSACTNGLIQFGGSTTDYTSDPIPNAGSPNNIIAAFWTDLRSGTGRILYTTRGTAPNRYFVIQYKDVELYQDANMKVSFQILLYEGSNTIEIQYQRIDSFAADSRTIAIGIENSSGVDGIQYLRGTQGQSGLFPRVVPFGITFTRPVIAMVESKYVRPNFPAALASCATTSGQKTITCASTAGLAPGMDVSGANVPSGAVVEAITNATTFTLNLAATGTGSGFSLLVSGRVDIGSINIGLDPEIGTVSESSGTVRRFEAPEFIYLSRNFQQLSAVGELTDPADNVAWYRLVNDGYAIDGQIVQGTHTFFTTTLTHDVTVIWRWRLEYAVIIDAATAAGGFGNPVPEVGRKWYKKGDQFNAAIDTIIGPQEVGFRSMATGYTLFDKNGTQTAFTDLRASANLQSSVAFSRQASTPISITDSLRFKWEIIGQVRYRFDAASGQVGESSNFLNGQSFVIVDGAAPVYGSGQNKDVWINIGTPVEVGAFYRTTDRCFTLADFPVSPGGNLAGLGADLSVLADVTVAGRVARTRTVAGGATQPTEVHWFYQPTVFRAEVALGSAVNPNLLVPALCDGAVLSDAGPSTASLIPVGALPTGRASGFPWRWDRHDKKVYPVHPCSNRVQWQDKFEPSKSYTIEIVSGYPGDDVTLSSERENADGSREGSAPDYVFQTELAGVGDDFPAAPTAHYRHLFDPVAGRQPPTNLDISSSDEWAFKELAYHDESADATVSANQSFTALGEGRSVLLYSYRPNPDENADGNLAKENLAVRVVRSSPVTVISRNDPKLVLGHHALELGGGPESAGGAYGVIQTGVAPPTGSVVPGDRFVVDFWLNAKGLRPPAAVVLSGCTTISGATGVTCASTGELVPGMGLSGTNIPAGTKIASITNGTTLVLSTAATANGSDLSLTASNKPVTVVSTGGGGLKVTLDAEASTVTATYRGVRVSHGLSKSGVAWRHYAIHVFTNTFFGVGVTVVDFYLDGVRQEQGFVSSWFPGSANSIVGSQVTDNSLRFGVDADPRGGLQLDNFRLFSLGSDPSGYLSAGEVRQLRGERDMTAAGKRLRGISPQLSFHFESAPASGWFANQGTLANVALGTVTGSGSYAGTWANVDLQEVATRLDSTLDNAGFSGSGFILNAVSNYNARIYQRSAEIGAWGPIFPVNDKQLFTEPEKKLEVAYYENPYLTDPIPHPNVAWPYVVTEYKDVGFPALGPHKDKAIYIASRIGSEGVDVKGYPQQVFDPAGFSDLKIYNQPEKAIAGYNPNEEHALTAPSGRAALKIKNLGEDIPNNPPLAAFALQADINATSNPYTSAPWVLVQVNNLATGEPEMAAYQVFKTRLGETSTAVLPFPRPSDAMVNSTAGLAYESAANPEDRFLSLDPSKPHNFCYAFSYPVAAGDLLIPPYPLNLVIGNTVMRDARGGNDSAQRTLWTDVYENAWVVSGNGRFFYQYYYPFRGDFYLPSTTIATPVAWVPDLIGGKRSFTGAGAALNPGKVVYNSFWRGSYPKLKRGETLTYQGGEYFNENPGSKGLPALVAMKAAEIVYDVATPNMIIGDNNVDAGSARIIRPLDRCEAPFTVAQMAAAGFSPASPSVFVVAERWFFKDLPGSLQRRFYFDSLAAKLVFRGYLNDKDSGDAELTAGPDPLNILEPNVITADDLALIKPLGSSPAWNEAVTAIHTRSINPTLIRQELAPLNPVMTGKYLAGMKEAPVVTGRIGLNLQLYAANEDLAAERARIKAQEDENRILEEQWKLLLTNQFQSDGGFVFPRPTVSTATATAIQGQVDKLGYEISKLPSAAESRYSHLDSFGVGAALVPSPALLTAPVSGSRYITIVENNRAELEGSPVSLHIVELIPDRYRGALKVIEATDAFSEKVTIQHNGEFGANTGDLYYEWWIRDAAPLDVVAKEVLANGNLTETDASGHSLWQQYLPKARVEDASLNDFQKHLGLNSIVFEGRPDVTLADKLVLMRYRHKDETSWNLVPFEFTNPSAEWQPGSPAPFQWAGAANSPQLQADGSKRYVPQLVMGWVKRVLDRINPYEARYTDFFSNESPATYSSQIQIAGAPFAGKVALNSDKNVIENTGLIELYETVLARARELSIDNSSNGNTSDGINQALLLAATRLSVLYELLAREAYSDAQDSTITVTDDSGLASVASFTHAFQNFEPDLMHEELSLLRGTDFRKSYPVYNRLFWNYAKGLGEAAYNVNYNIHDANLDGFINEDDARALYPQGHGDAWGHFASAIGMHYTLLQHPGFSWKTRSELYSLMENVLEVDFLDEKTFAKLAAGRARAGRDIVRGSYRLAYTQDPDGQWQGYTDGADPARAWGVSEWAHRTGEAAYFDWAVANAILPAQAAAATPVTNPENLDRIERLGAIDEIGEVAAGLHEIQVAMDEANRGVNPLGFDSNAIAFDINPFYDGESWELTTHFEQIYARAVDAGQNALATLDFASKVGNKLYQLADDTNTLIVESFRQDLDYRNRLIEIFGRPYEGTIGFGKVFPEGYEGPDTQLFSYLNRTAITQIVPETNANAPVTTVRFAGMLATATGLADNGNIQNLYADVLGNFYENIGTAVSAPFGLLGVDGTTLGVGQAELKEAFITLAGTRKYEDFSDSVTELSVPVRKNSPYAFQAPADWGQRASYGKIQRILEEELNERIALDSAVNNYLGFLTDFEVTTNRLRSEIELIQQRADIRFEVAIETLISKVLQMSLDAARAAADQVGDSALLYGTAASEGFPKVIGFSNDATSIGRAGVLVAAASIKTGTGVSSKIAQGVKQAAQFLIEALKDDRVFDAEQSKDIATLEGLLVNLVSISGNDVPMRDAIGTHLQNIELKRQEYFSAQAEGFRLLREREAFNKILASKVQKNRYNDMIFRLSRNEAMTKYQSAFNHAARYAWLAARAYDYETSLDPGDSAAPGALLDQIVKERQLGLWSNGQPQAGKGGLAEILNHLQGDFKVLKGQLGINSPQSEIEKISLRGELFRIVPADANIPASDDRWKDAIKARIVPDLNQMPEFVRHCRPFAASTSGPQPGIVIRFGTRIEPGLNFFGLPLAAGDHNYSSANFATKVRGFGVWLENYNAAGLSTSPRAYMVPVGNDYLRASSSDAPLTRMWNVQEQRIPTPFVINRSNLIAPGYVPTLDGLDGTFGQLRRHGDFRMYHDNGDPEADDSELILDSRLIGRSVWNSEWMLVIPGAGLHVDPLTGLTKLADTVSDIKLHFKTYSHQGQ